MLSRLIRNRKTIGAGLVLIGLFLAAGFAGSCDTGSMCFFKAALGALVSLAMMGAGAVLIGGEQNEGTL